MCSINLVKINTIFFKTNRLSIKRNWDLESIIISKNSHKATQLCYLHKIPLESKVRSKRVVLELVSKKSRRIILKIAWIFQMGHRISIIESCKALLKILHPSTYSKVKIWRIRTKIYQETSLDQPRNSNLRTNFWWIKIATWRRLIWII